MSTHASSLRLPNDADTLLLSFFDSKAYYDNGVLFQISPGIPLPFCILKLVHISLCLSQTKGGPDNPGKCKDMI